MDDRQAQFTQAYLEQLKDARILDAGVADDGTEYNVFLTVELSNGKRHQLFIYADQEGNDSGYLFGLPHPVNPLIYCVCGNQEGQRKEGAYIIEKDTGKYFAHCKACNDVTRAFKNRDEMLLFLDPSNPHQFTMCRRETMDTFEVNAHGNITSPGKFEGEQLYAPYFWEVILNGDGCPMRDKHDDEWTLLNVNNEERDEFPELGDAHRVALFESDNGFVYIVDDTQPYFNELSDE